MTLRILITGVGGCLGSHLAEYVLRAGHAVAGIGRLKHPENVASFRNDLDAFEAVSLPDPSFVQMVKAFRPDALIHCAGPASVPDSMDRPHPDFIDSVGLCAFVLDTLRQHAPATHVTLFSSAAVYGNPPRLPVTEETPSYPLSPYGFHKRCCELLGEEYHRVYGIPLAAVRPFSVYGPRLRKQVVRDLLRKTLFEDEETLTVYGTGAETRDFLHTDDLARAVTLVVEKRQTGLLNIGAGRETTIADLAKAILSVCASDKTLRFTGETRPGDPLRWQADVSRLATLGFAPTVSLQDGLARTRDWLRAQEDSPQA